MMASTKPTAADEDFVPQRPIDDERWLHAIVLRYHGRMDTLSLTPEVLQQLALDLGMLTGMCARLLQEKENAHQMARASNAEADRYLAQRDALLVAARTFARSIMEWPVEPQPLARR